MKKLTEKQQKILDYIMEEEMNGHFLTYREIQQHFRLRSVATAFQHVSALENAGFIKREGKARSIRFKGKMANKFPLLGSVHAGMPALAVEEIEGFLPLPIDTRTHPRAFLLRVKGDSMTEAHIENGDLVVVDPEQQVGVGDICVALIEDEATVKRLEKRRNGLYLVPANPKYKPIYITRETKIIGKVIGLWRSSF